MKRILTFISMALAAACVSMLVPLVGKEVPAQAQPSRQQFRWETGRVVTPAELNELLTETSAQPPAQGGNIRLNQSGPAAETTVVIDPTNPNNIIAAAMDSSQLAVRATPYASSDGGQTWDQQNGLRNFVRAPDGATKVFQNESDPVLTADSRGNIYLSTIMWETATDDNGVYLFKSVNGGRRFSTGVPIVTHIGQSNPPFEDKEWITADTTGGRFNDSIYAAWVSLRPPPEARQIQFSRSTDGGATFSPPQPINDDLDINSSVQGPMVQVGPGGEVYVAWLHSRPGRPAEILMEKSVDGGVTFGTDVFVASTRGFGRLRGLARHGGSLLTLAVDRSTGSNRENLYIVWADNRNGDVDILLTRSTDGGGTWSEPVRVNDDPLGNGKDQFMPFVTVDQTTGDVVVGYYDRRESIENFLVDYHVTWSTDGGITFVPSLKVTPQGFDPSAAFRFIQAAGFVCQAPFMGDYTSLAANGGLLYPVWTDTRNGRADVFTQPIRFH
jgi:hypothetical protein